MDPVTQGVLGANFSQSFASKKHFHIATISGILGGMFPDIDVLIQSSTDPMLALQFHRHFTHSLAMAPLLSLIVAAVIWIFARKHATFGFIYLFSFLGLITHGLLDCCTTYGTMLLWPFSNERIAWNSVSIIDPLFTLPALAGVIWAAKKQSRKVAHFTFAYMMAYLLFGVYQRDQAVDSARELAARRGHEVIRVVAEPSMFNLVLWRTIYETPDHVFHVDAIHTLPFTRDKVYEGQSIARWLPERAQLEPGSTIARDVEIFRWFADDFLIESAAGVIGDLRYATLPNSIEPIWGIAVPQVRSPASHAERKSFRVMNKDTLSTFKAMLLRR